MGADYIDDVDVVRAGGMKALFDGVCVPQQLERCWGSLPLDMPGSWSRCSVRIRRSWLRSDAVAALGAAALITRGRAQVA